MGKKGKFAVFSRRICKLIKFTELWRLILHEISISLLL